MHRESPATDEITLREYWHVLAKRRRLILSVVCTVAISTAIITLMQPNIYQAKAGIILTGQATSGLPAVMGEVGSLLPVNTGIENSNSAAILFTILQSRTLAENVIQHLGLLHILFSEEWDAMAQRWLTDDPPTLQKAIIAMRELVLSAMDEKQQVMITITGEHADPVLAAALVNKHIEVLQQMVNENAFSLAKKNRLFIADQLQQTQQALVVAEEALQKFEQTYGIVSLDAQTQAVITTLAGLAGQIMAKEVQLGVLQRSLSGASREVYLLQEELQGLRDQLARLQNGTPELSSAPPTQTPNKPLLLALDKAPEVKLQYARLQREALLQNQLFALLAQQLEQARIEEAQDETVFQVLDRAVPPEIRVRPKFLLLIILGFMLGVFVAFFLTFFLEYMDTTIRTREQVEEQIGTALLATIPPLAPQNHRHQQGSLLEPLLMLNAPRGAPFVEGFHHLYTCLKRLKEKSCGQAVLLVSTGMEETATTVLANLAIVAARLGDRTLMVDSNVHHPALHSLFHCALAPGLIENLTNNSAPFVVQATSIDNLYLMPAGAATLTSYAPLESAVFDALLARCKESYDLILYATPAVLAFTDAVVLGRKVDATCLVLTYGISRVATAIEARNALATVKANLIGAVLTAFTT